MCGEFIAQTENISVFFSSNLYGISIGSLECIEKLLLLCWNIICKYIQRQTKIWYFDRKISNTINLLCLQLLWYACLHEETQYASYLFFEIITVNASNQPFVNSSKIFFLIWKFAKKDIIFIVVHLLFMWYGVKQIYNYLKNIYYKRYLMP